MAEVQPETNLWLNSQERGRSSPSLRRWNAVITQSQWAFKPKAPVYSGIQLSSYAALYSHIVLPRHHYLFSTTWHSKTTKMPLLCSEPKDLLCKTEVSFRLMKIIGVTRSDRVALWISQRLPGTIDLSACNGRWKITTIPKSKGRLRGMAFLFRKCLARVVWHLFGSIFTLYNL
jgi:predicted phosphoadenosine phosphosulfate sulfurtransferase